MLTQDDISDPLRFNLLVVYAPLSGGVGVPTPVVVEQFDGLDLEQCCRGRPPRSKLVKVKSFEDEPNLTLSAYDLMHYDANQATPVITLTSTLDADNKTWTAEQDLLGGRPS